MSAVDAGAALAMTRRWEEWLRQASRRHEHGKASDCCEPLRMSVSQWALVALNCRGLETVFAMLGLLIAFAVCGRETALLT